MRLTPLDIRKQEFRKGMRGLDADEVYAFLSTVADEYEAVINDNKALRERLLELDDKVQEYRNMEKTLRDTLLTAERVTVDAKENARRESDLIVKEAQIEAEKAVRDIRTTAMKLRQEIQELRQQRDSYLSRMKILVDSHLRFIESAEKDYAEEERELTAAFKNEQVAEPQLSETQPVAAQPEPQPEIPTETQPSKTSEMLDRVLEQQKDALATETDSVGREQVIAPDLSTEKLGPALPNNPVGREQVVAPDKAQATMDAPISEVKLPETVQPANPAAPSATNEQRPDYHRESQPGDRPAEKQTVAAPGAEAPGAWSLEKLKRDILSGSKPDNEKD
jgi:cell division initiation protein